VPLLGLIGQQRYFVSYLFIVLHRYLDPSVVHVQQLQQLEWYLTVLTLVAGRDILVLTVPTDLLFLEVPVGRQGIDHGRPLHLVPPHPRHLLLLVLLLVDVLLGVLIVEPDGLVVAVIIGVVQGFSLLGSFLLSVGLDVLHDLR
jgi:hypothetical protein